VVWHLQQSKRRLGGQEHCKEYRNVAGRTEWDGDLELLLVEDKDNLITKVGRVSASVVMDLLAVLLG
jgi:hypothetical protein